MSHSRTAPQSTSTAPGIQVAPWQRHLLRAMYLLIAVGLGITMWPDILWHNSRWGLMDGVVTCMLGAFSILCLIGVRYPLRMLPVLLWELVWKCMWLGIVAWPLYTTGQMDAAFMNVASACLFVVVLPLVLPWRYVFTHYLSPRGERSVALPAMAA